VGQLAPLVHPVRSAVGDSVGLSFHAQMTLLSAVAFLTVAETVGLLAFYVVYVFRNAGIAPGKQFVWIGMFVLWSVFAMPLFWYLHVWPKNGTPTAPDNTHLGNKPGVP